MANVALICGVNDAIAGITETPVSADKFGIGRMDGPV